MRVVIAGGHGKIALHLERRLAERGDEAVGIVRNPHHLPDLETIGARGVVLDLEQATVDQVADVLPGADAVVFAAGGGPGSGATRKETVDKNAAILLADAALRAGVRRYLMVSAMGTEAADPSSDDVMHVYLRAKQAADDHVRSQDLDWTVLKPGHLTNDPGTGRVRLGVDGTFAVSDVPRDDVAAVLLALLDDPATAGMTLAVIGGTLPVDEALQALR